MANIKRDHRVTGLEAAGVPPSSASAMIAHGCASRRHAVSAPHGRPGSVLKMAAEEPATVGLLGDG